MSSTPKSLWPEVIGVKKLPAPVQLLQEQGEVLETLTGGKLYGEASPSSFPAADAVRYDFFVGVNGKAIRHKLLSVEIGLLFDYPVTIVNHEAGTTERVDEANYPEAIGRILRSDVTQSLLERLMEFADP
jgi:hypothetical protein